MIAFWRKDLPWLCVLGLGGAVALALAIAERGFLEVFVVAPHRLELAHWFAGSLGLLLGVVAVVWDDLLGTREYLRQRPISAARMAMAPILTCIAVLVCWAVIVPVLAWLFAAIGSGIFAPTHWRGVPEIELTLAYAWPAAAIGCLAAALPVAPFVRLLTMGCLVAVLGCGIDLLVHEQNLLVPNWNGESDALGFLAACLGSAAVLFAFARRALSVRHDPDRPWPMATRARFGGLLLLVMAATAAGFVALLQYTLLNGLRREYPELLMQGDRVLLARRTEDYRHWQVVDAEHAPVGALVPYEGVTQLPLRGLDRLQRLEMDVPRWHEGSRAWWFRRGATLLLDDDGSAWIYDVDRGIERTGIGEELRPLPSGCVLQRLDAIDAGPGLQRLVVGDRASGALWLLEARSDRFEPVPLPDGDRFVSFGSATTERFVEGDAARAIASLFDKNTALGYVRGENGTYLLAEGAWRRTDIAPRAERTRTPHAEVVRTGDDLLAFSVRVVPESGAPAFTHDYRPRTAEERAVAGLALGTPLLRTPLLQLASFLFSAPDAPSSPWSDPLLAGGKRWWLLLLCFAFAAGCVWHTRRWLRRQGADEATVRFWSIAVAGTGLVGVLVVEFCERPRAHARRALPAPPPPRIVSAEATRGVTA